MKKKNFNGSAGRTILILLLFIAFCSIIVSGGKTFSKYLFNKEFDVTIASSEKFKLTDISDIILTSDKVRVTEQLTAGDVTPSAANPSVTYKWFLGTDPNDAASFSEITGITSKTYTPVDGDLNCYIKVQAEGDGVKYYGDVLSEAVGPVFPAPLIPIDSVAINGASNPPQISDNLTFTVQPTSATVNYSWSRSTDGVTWNPCANPTAAAHVIDSGDLGCYIKIQVDGTVNYTGTKTAVTSSKVANKSIVSVALNNLAPTVGTALSGTINPTGAASTAGYAWYRSTDGTSWGSQIAATAAYTATIDDVNNYIKLVVTGNGDYTGSASSATTTLVTGISLTGVTLSSMTPTSGTALSATITPTGGDVGASYAWYKSTDGTTWGSSIATTATYTPLSTDAGNYIKLIVTGGGKYKDSVNTVTTSKVRIPLTSVTLSDYAPQVRQTVTATMAPTGATVNYQWYRSTSTSGPWTSVSGATTSPDRLVVSADCDNYLRVVATGTGDYTGSVESISTATVVKIPLTAAITGALGRNGVLTADVTPSDAAVSYQWYSSSSSSGSNPSTINGATSKTYTISGTSLNGKYIYVTVTPTDASSDFSAGTSDCVGPVDTSKGLTSVTINSVTWAANNNLSCTVKRNTTTVTSGFSYAWYRSTDGVNWGTAIATTSTYKLLASDAGKKFMVTVTGNGSTYTGTVTSPVVGWNTVSLSSSSIFFGTQVTASASLAAGVTVTTYTWQRGATATGSFTNVGATGATYTPQLADFGNYLRVEATLSNGTTVYATSDGTVGPKALSAVSLSPSSVPYAGITMTATTTPSGAAVVCVWECMTTSNNIWVQTSTDGISHTVTSAEWDSYNYIRVTVTSDSPAYSGSVTSSQIPLY